MGNIPRVYMRSHSHKIAESIVFDQEQVHQVVLVGPKGTGKTTCLVAIWGLYKMSGKPVIFTSTNAIRMYDTETVQKYTRKITGKFPKYIRKWKKMLDVTARAYVSFLYKFVNHLCNKNEKVVLLIDFNKFLPEDNDVTIQLANLA